MYALLLLVVVVPIIVVQLFDVSGPIETDITDRVGVMYIIRCETACRRRGDTTNEFASSGARATACHSHRRRCLVSDFGTRDDLSKNRIIICENDTRPEEWTIIYYYVYTASHASCSVYYCAEVSVCHGRRYITQSGLVRGSVQMTCDRGRGI